MSDNPNEKESPSPDMIRPMPQSPIAGSTNEEAKPVPRKRGRPRKPKPDGIEQAPKRKPGRPRKILGDESTRLAATRPRGRPVRPKVEGPKRRPGRPRKIPSDDPAVVKRSRGRPRKVTTEVGEQKAAESGEKRKRGRPRKNPESTVGQPQNPPADKEKRKRGRPRKVPVLAVGQPQNPPADKQKRGPGRPRKKVPMVITADADEPIQRKRGLSAPNGDPPRKRGRPKKIVPKETSVDELGGEYASSSAPPEIVLTDAKGTAKAIRQVKTSAN